MPASANLFFADQRLLILPVIGAIAGIYFFYKGFRLLKRKRLILNTPASKVRSASMGLVEISGLATGPYIMRSPLKGVDCFYYQSTAWEMRQRGKNSEWVKVAEENLHVPFYIDDSTDKVLIDPRGADMDLHCDFHEEYHRSVLFEGPDMPLSVEDFLSRHGVDASKRIKVEERCIKPKNFLFVLGTLSQNPGFDASIAPAWAERIHGNPVPAEQESGPEVIRLTETAATVPVTAMTQQQKIAAALSKAGIANPAAWDVALSSGAAAAASVAKISTVTKPQISTQEVGSFDLHPPVVLMKGSHEPTFFISWRSQRDIVASLSWKSSLMIWGGPALTLLCVYLLLAHFGQL